MVMMEQQNRLNLAVVRRQSSLTVVLPSGTGSGCSMRKTRVPSTEKISLVESYGRSVEGQQAITVRHHSRKSHRRPPEDISVLYRVLHEQNCLEINEQNNG